MRTQASAIPAPPDRFERRFAMPDPYPQFRPDNLEHLRKQAKKLLRDALNGDAPALARFATVLGPTEPGRFALSQAQFVIAREAGFSDWPKLNNEAAWREDTRSKHQLGSATLHTSESDMPTNESLNLGAIDQIALSCTDLDEAEHFYCEILGLRSSGEVPGVMKFFDCDGVNIVMFKTDSVQSNSVIYFRVPPELGLIERQLTLLKSKGVRVESDPHIIARNWKGRDVWMGFFRDPFGNLLALKSDVPVK
jgi:catechol 2,3-dioxygenase-like lactoylglutathione lyase family enzyme